MESNALDMLQQTKIPYSFTASNLMPLLIHLPKLPCSPHQCKAKFCWAGAEGTVLEVPLQSVLSISDELPRHFPQEKQALIPVLQPNSSLGHDQQFNFPHGVIWARCSSPSSELLMLHVRDRGFSPRLAAWQ